MISTTPPDFSSFSPKLYSQALIPLKYGQFTISVFKFSLSPSAKDEEVVTIHQGELSSTHDHPLFVRIHSECFTGEVLSSLKCDCKFQLEQALGEIARLGRGILIYLDQEGRGIGLADKIKAYHLQNQGLNTLTANEALGLPADQRHFFIAASLLKFWGVKHVTLNTNNPRKIKDLINSGIDVVEVLPSLSPVNQFNRDYLQTKMTSLGHLHLQSLFENGEPVNP